MPEISLAKAIAFADQESRQDSRPSGVFVPQVWIVLPAFNEEENIARLLMSIDQAAIGAKNPYSVVVVDDGSSDGTAIRCQAVQVRVPVELVRHEVNQGLGPTLRDGLRFVADRADPDDIVITMDADMSHPPALVHPLVQAISEGRDVVVASRFRQGAAVRGVPAHRQTCSILASWLFRVFRPIRGVRDFTCGYRAYRVSLMQKAFAHYGPHFIEATGFDCMVEVLMKLRRFQPLVGEVPLVLRYDWKGGVSKMRVWRTASRLLQHLIGCARANE